MSIPSNELLGDIVHRILPYLKRNNITSQSEFASHLTHITNNTRNWSQLQAAYQQRVISHWGYITGLYLESSNVWFEQRGLQGYRPDMTRRLKNVYQVIEFKVVSNPSNRKKSGHQIRDTATLLRQTLPAGTPITGHIVILSCDITQPETPVWKDINLTPAAP